MQRSFKWLCLHIIGIATKIWMLPRRISIRASKGSAEATKIFEVHIFDLRFLQSVSKCSLIELWIFSRSWCSSYVYQRQLLLLVLFIVLFFSGNNNQSPASNSIPWAFRISTNFASGNVECPTVKNTEDFLASFSGRCTLLSFDSSSCVRIRFKILSLLRMKGKSVLLDMTKYW